MDDRRTVDTRLGPLAVRLLGDGPPAVLWHSLFAGRPIQNAGTLLDSVELIGLCLGDSE
jgi:hypothetical protein